MKEELTHTHSAIDGETCPMVRRDVVFYETTNGGPVFSASSIAWAGALYTTATTTTFRASPKTSFAASLTRRRCEGGVPSLPPTGQSRATHRAARGPIHAGYGRALEATKEPAATSGILGI
jgi:hypothetical protein